MRWRRQQRSVRRPAMLLLALALATCLQGGHAANLARFVVSYADVEQRGVLEQQLEQQGYHVLSKGPGFFAVTHPTAAVASAAGTGSSSSSSRKRRQLQEAAAAAQQAAVHAQHVARLGALPGASSSEADLRRYLHAREPAWHEQQQLQRRRLTAAGSQAGDVSLAVAEAARARMSAQWSDQQRLRPKAYESWGIDVVDAMCAGKDVQLNPDAAMSEVLPWGIAAIGANNETLQKLPPKGRSIVCIIDSGLAMENGEFSDSRASLAGCTSAASCPYTWHEDIVGHGTHVAGTIGAPRNGRGVVGVMAHGAELYIVRVWNNSGDVSQGQGPYATDMVLAYSQCLDYLTAQQAKSRGTVTMVINMSFGSAGPLTVESKFINRAAKRGDVLFVGSAGNNGSWLDLGKRTGGAASLSSPASSEPAGQFMSYPASYRLDEVMSVANARCDGSIELTSQKNKQVSIAAPGMAILSTAPRAHGTIRGHLSSEPPVVASTPGSAKAGGAKAGGTAATSVVLGYLANGLKEPRPIQGTRVGGTAMLPLAVCELKQARFRLFARHQEGSCPAAKGGICMYELPGATDWSQETCAAMLGCVRSGGQGLVLWRQDKAVGISEAQADASYDLVSSPLEVLLATQLNCGERCKCWGELQTALRCTGDGPCSNRAPPGVVISAKHAAALLAAGAARGAVKAALTTHEYNYKFFDGTSMAAPHVSGAAALLWRLFPACRAADIAAGLKQSAQRLPGQAAVPDFSAGYGLLRVDHAYEWLRKHRPCAAALD